MQEFLNHVKEGLSKPQKKLSSRYFYDEKGDQLFQHIMTLDEYYLPRCEMQIIQSQSEQIAKDISKFHSGLQIVELGAGDGTKTMHLLKIFDPNFTPMQYVALDISSNVLSINGKEIKSELKHINHISIPGDYFETYKNLSPTQHGRLVLFLGANIGNYNTEEIIEFFKFIKSKLSENDFFLVAFDLAKDPRKIRAAYDDREGATRDFNLNLLVRINRELGANFDISKFDHFPFYNPTTGIASSQIISLIEQNVQFPDGYTASFDAFETIHTEVSKKFFWKEILHIANDSKVSIIQKYFDSKQEYAFILFQPKAE